MRPAEILRAARVLIATPERWTQGAIGRYENGQDTGGQVTGAVCFCVDGALLSLLHVTPVRGASLYLSRAARGMGAETASKFNDAPETTHADVLALYDRAIGLAELEEALAEMLGVLDVGDAS